jgi:hypothetical protein
MSVSLHEHRLGSLRWLVLTGPDREAFGALGEHMRAELTALAGAWPVLPRLRRHVSGPPGRDRLAAVRRATQEAFLAEWAELAAFAAGAGVQFDDLALLNLRGDLGLVDGGIGCSDLGWRRERSVVAHNEDGALEDVGRCALLTMTGIGRPPVTAFWYPGFVPANAFALTGDGLVWTVDHLPVAAPGPGAGRHFVGRGLQRTARTVDDAVGYLRSRPSAGGFSYTIGDRAGRVVSVEAAAGHYAVTEAGPGRGPLLWHTNHGRYLSGAEPEADGTSAARGPRPDAGRPRRPGRGPESVLVPRRPHPSAAGWRPLRPRAGRPRADHAVHARRRPDRGGGRDRTARRAACRDPAGRPGRGQLSRAAPLRARDVLAG